MKRFKAKDHLISMLFCAFAKCNSLLFSQIYDQFSIKRNYTKSFLGFKTRIISKITAINLNGNNHKVYFLKWPSYPFKIHYSIIEGIDSTYGLFEKMFGQEWHFNNNFGSISVSIPFVY